MGLSFGFVFLSVRFGSYGKFRFFVFLGGGVGLSLFVFKKKNAKHVALDEPARCEQTNRRFEYFATKQPKVALIVPTESSSQASFPIRMIIPPKKINNANAVCAGRTGLNWSSAKPPTRTMSFQVRSLWIWRPIVRLEIDLPNRSLWSSRSRGGQDASTGTGLWIMVVQFSARRGGISRSIGSFCFLGSVIPTIFDDNVLTNVRKFLHFLRGHICNFEATAAHSTKKCFDGKLLRHATAPIKKGACKFFFHPQQSVDLPKRRLDRTSHLTKKCTHPLQKNSYLQPRRCSSHLTEN